MSREVDLGYQPRPQFIPFHKRKERWACVVAHRRAGKTVACVMDLLDHALRFSGTDGRFAYIAPYYAQAKDVVWTYLKSYGLLIPGAQPNESELRLDLPNGARVRLYGADNYDRLRGIYLDGVVLDEYGDMDPRALAEVIRPALADRKGWAVFIGTPKGRNGFHEVHTQSVESPDWYSLVLKASESGLIDPQELADARGMMSEDQYQQEFECSFDAAVVGAYYARLIAEAEPRITSVPLEPDLPIHTSWDLGIDDSTSIWVWQPAPDGMRLIDHIEDTGKGLQHYVDLLAERGYTGGIDYVPHDARVRELGTGLSRLETLVAMGRCPEIVPMNTVEDGINAVRQLLPRMWFDKTRCAFGLDCLRNYRTEYDDKNKVFRNRPKHDWTSHAADSLRYGALAYRELAMKKIREIAKPLPGQVWIGPPEDRQYKRSAF